MRIAAHVGMMLLLAVGFGFLIRQQLSQQRQQLSQREEYRGLPADLQMIDEARPDRIEPPPKPDLQPGDDWLTCFELTERSGQVVTTESLLGQPYLVSFFFTLCPSICVKQNQQLAELQAEFAGQPVRFLSISVDPENDRPEALREYASRFNADPEQWLFLTADDPIYVRRVGAEIYQVSADLEHTERFILVNPEGEIEGLYMWSYPKSLARLKRDIAALIASQPESSDS